MNLRALLLLLALAATSCGNEDQQATSTASRTPDPTSTTSPAVTAEPAKPVGPALSALCRRWKPKWDALNDQYAAQANAGAWAEAADTMRSGIAETRRFNERVAKLKAPPNQTDALRRYQGAQRRLVALNHEAVPATETGDLEKLNEIGQRTERLRAARLEVALELEADACGS